MSETVLVIGGSGQLGAPVVRQLRGDGYRVRLLVRTPTATRDRNADLELSSITPVWNRTRPRRDIAGSGWPQRTGMRRLW